MAADGGCGGSRVADDLTMRWSAVVRRARALLRRGQVEREMEDELALHLELQERALERQGMPPAEAHRRARAAFGAQATREAYRDARGVRPLEDLGRDVVYACRSLRRRPAFTLVTLLTIALGIGAATSIYTIVDGVLLRPLPFSHPDRLVQVDRTFPAWKKQPILESWWNQIPLSVPEYRLLRDDVHALSSVALWQAQRQTLTDGDRPERVPTMLATPQLLTVLGAHMYRGRFFGAEDDLPGAAPVAVISYERWRAQFGGGAAIGRTIHFEDKPYTIVGILPPALDVSTAFPDPLGLPAFWIPLGPAVGRDYDERTNHGYNAVARLAPGVSIETAEAAARSALTDPRDSATVGTRLVAWGADEKRTARNPLLVLLGGAGLLLIIACVNVATLLLGEAGTREREMAARGALGAGRWRLTRQLLTESLALSALGGSLGVAAGWAGTHGLVSVAPKSIPNLTDVVMDGRVLAAAQLAVVVTGMVFGAVPALVSSSVDPATVLRAGVGQSKRGRGALQRLMVAAEFALSLVLLTGAALLVRSFRNMTAVDPGFDPTGLVYVNTVLPRTVLDDSGAVRRVYDAAAPRLAALPGVRGALLVTGAPFSGGPSSTVIDLEGETALSVDSSSMAGLAAPTHQVEQSEVGVGFFRLLGVRIVAGRTFTAGDRGGAPPVAIINQAAARADFPGQNPVGKRVRYHGVWCTIVGVSSDVRNLNLRAPAHPAIFTPIAQRPIWGPQIVMRTGGSPPTEARIQAALSEVDSRLIVTDVHPMTQLIADTVAADRYRAMLMSLFGVLAAVLSAIGMYGVTARAVARRRREVGIRLALGATRTSVVKQMLRATITGAGLGLVVGVAATLALARLLAPFLFGVAPSDPATYAAIAALLGITAVLAAWLPASRAGRMQVVEVLHAD